MHSLESANHPNIMMCNAYGKSHNGNTIWMWAFAPGFHDMMSWYFRAAPEPSSSPRSTAGSTMGSPSRASIPMSPSRSTISPSARQSRSSSLLSVPREQSGTSQKSADQQDKLDTASKERETEIAAREAKMQVREDQASQREAELDKTAQHLLTQKENLQTQLAEKQKLLQAKADELGAREMQLANKERAIGSTATERTPKPNEELEAEIEKLRVRNFGLQADATEAEKIRDENIKLKKAVAENRSAAGNGGGDDDETEEEAAKTRDAIARQDATPFADVRRLTVLLEQQVANNEEMAQALAKVKKERDDLKRKREGKAMVLKGHASSGLDGEMHNLFSLEGLGNGAASGNVVHDKQKPFSLVGLGHGPIGSADMISHFEEKTREAVGRNSEGEFQVLKRL